MRFQPALNKTFCRKPPPPTHLQLEHSKILKKQTFCHFPHYFLTEGSFTIKQIYICSSREMIPHRRHVMLTC